MSEEILNDLVYEPEDIIDEEVDFEVLPEAYSAPLNCPGCGLEMDLILVQRPIAGGKFTATYEAYQCPRCGQRYLNPEQAKRFSSVLLLERLFQEKKEVLPGDVLFDGRDFFVRLSLLRDLARLEQEGAGSRAEVAAS
jgi:predicted RNA-binding Zn-ribbon protein involved in translation (DUF1610 family)